MTTGPRSFKPTTAQWLALIVLGSIISQGYVAGIINHGIQLPLIRQFAGDDTFRNDAFVQEMARTYTTLFYPAVGLLAKELPLVPLLFVLFVLFRAGSVYLSYRLGRALFDDERIGLWTAAATSVHTLAFAEDVVSDTYLTHGALAQVMTLGALVLLAERRIVSAFALAGLLFDVHAMHATHLLVAMGVAVLATRDAAERKEIFRPLALGAFAALAALTPTLYWMKSEAVLGARVPPGFIETIHGWFPTHFWPSSWGVTDWLCFIFPTFGALPIYRLAGPGRDGGRTARVAAAALAFAVAGGLGAEVHATPFLIRLHPMRSSWIMLLAGAPYFAAAGIALLRRGREAARKFARVDYALGLVLLSVLAFPWTYRSAAGCTLLPALWAVAFDAVGGWMVAATLLAALSIPIFQEAWTAHALVAVGRFYEIAQWFIAAQGFMAFLGALLIAFAYLRSRGGAAPAEEGRRRTLLRVVAALAALQLSLHALGHAALVRRGLVHEWREVQDWCREHLSKGEIVLVPLAQIGLRAFSDQSPAVDFQEGDALLHNPEYMLTFIPKLERYGWKLKEVSGFDFYTNLEELDQKLTTDDVLRLGKELGAKIAVRRSRYQKLDLPVLFQNGAYIIYDLRPRSGQL